MSTKLGRYIHYRVSAAANSCRPMMINADVRDSDTVSGYQLDFNILSALLPTARTNIVYDPNVTEATGLPAGTAGTWHYMESCPD